MPTTIDRGPGASGTAGDQRARTPPQIKLVRDVAKMAAAVGTAAAVLGQLPLPWAPSTLDAKNLPSSFQDPSGHISPPTLHRRADGTMVLDLDIRSVPVLPSR